MADKRRGKGKRREEDQDKPTKDEYAVAKFMRFNVPVKEGKLVGMTVQYFISSKALDALMESKWCKGDKALFTSRTGCLDFVNNLLMKGLFHRAAKAERKKDKMKRSLRKKDDDEEEKKPKKDKKKKEKDKEKDKGDKEDDKDSEEGEKGSEKKVEGKDEKKQDDEKKKKKEKKIKLEMHDQQIFKDGDEVYVWIYDPVPVKTFLIGLLLVLGAIGVCLFPLWPPEVRLGVYYISLAAAVFVGGILSLCIIRLVLFCIVWGVSFGRHHLWLLPNLTEDVGFFESFVPLYNYDYCGDMPKATDDKSKEGNEVEEKSIKEEVEEKDGDQDSDKEGKELDNNEHRTESGSEGAENDNGYEIVEAEDAEEDPEPKKTK